MVSNSDLQRWQQTINGITAAQSELSPEELSAFQTLSDFINSGNFASSESGGYIQIIKNAVKQHSKNRLLKAHLTNFVTLCKKFFKAQTVIVAAPTFVDSQSQITLSVFETPTFETPIFEPPAEETVQPKPQIQIPVITPTQEQQPDKIAENTVQKTDASRRRNSIVLIIVGIVIILLLGYIALKDSEFFNKIFSKEKTEIVLSETVSDTISNETIDTVPAIRTDTLGIITDTLNITDTIHVKDLLENENLAASPKEDTIRKEEPKQEPATVKTPSSSGQTQESNNTKKYSFGKYSGSLKNGIPEGKGTMIYTTHTRIAKHARETYYAENGDVFVGTWGNGDIVNGKLFDKNNNLKATILAGKRPNPYDISKD